MITQQRLAIAVGIMVSCLSVVGIAITMNTSGKLNGLDRAADYSTMGVMHPVLCEQLRHEMPQTVGQIVEDTGAIPYRITKMHTYACGDTGETVVAAYELDAGPDIWVQVPPDGEIYIFHSSGGLTQLGGGKARVSEKTLVTGNTKPR